MIDLDDYSTTPDEYAEMERDRILEIIEEDLDRLNNLKYSDNLKDSIEFGKGVLTKLKTQITGEQNNG